MIKNLIMLAALVLVGWVVYVSFYGDEKDKALRDKLFEGVKSTGQAIGDIFSSEKDKYQAGEYDEEIDRINGLISNLSSNEQKAKEDGVDYSSELEQLRQQKNDLEKKVEMAKKAQKAVESGREIAEEMGYEPTPEEIAQDFKAVQNTLDQISDKLEEE